MKAKLVRTQEGQFDVMVNGESVGTCKFSVMQGGRYETEMHDGIKITSFTQKSVKEMVERYLNEKDTYPKKGDD